MNVKNLRLQIFAYCFGILISATIVVSAITVFSLQQKSSRDIERFREQQITQVKDRLKDQVSIVYSFLKANYKERMSVEEIDALKNDIAEMRYADGVGYFWINDTARPYPNMVMHPTAPQLNGTVMNDAKYNCALGKGQNLFQAFVDVTSQKGDGFVDYLWPKPTKGGLSSDQPKLSYVRVFEPFGWIIGTGAYIDSIDEVVAAQQESDKDNITSVLMRFVIGIFAVCILAALSLAFLTKSIIKPIRRIISDLGEAISQISVSSSQITSTGHNLAEGASAQAATLEETAASITEMQSMSRQNADNSREADRMMQETNQVVDAANLSMGQLINSMQSISTASEETSKIITTIDQIAFQTNLLALNAAVEAARAGEAGAGFAVVADEVRNLALRAAESAKQTAILIEETVNRVSDGTLLVNATNENFTKVSESNIKVAQLISDITKSSNDQADGVIQINKALERMETTTLGLALSSEESASSSEALSSMINLMDGTVMELTEMAGLPKASHYKALSVNSSKQSSQRKELSLQNSGGTPCWETKNCPTERRDSCPAYPTQGNKCWMVTGTQCGGSIQGSFSEKMANCRKCNVFQAYN